MDEQQQREEEKLPEPEIVRNAPDEYVFEHFSLLDIVEEVHIAFSK